MITRPMLSATLLEEHFDGLRWPLFASPKLDGIRCLCHPALGPVTRSFKEIRNDHIRTVLNGRPFIGLDGELMLREGDFNTVQSAVMKKSGEPLFEFHVFDEFTVEDTWTFRFNDVLNRFPIGSHDIVKPVRHWEVNSKEEVLALEEQFIEAGYEGLMLRDPLCSYKSGRSTIREQGLMKWKRFYDAEGVVVGFIEQMHNANELETDAFGLAKRSSHRANLEGKNTLGLLVLQTEQWGEVHVGTGFTDLQRRVIWERKNNFLGKTVTFKYQEVLKNKPRFPVFLYVRED